MRKRTASILRDFVSDRSARFNGKRHFIHSRFSTTSSLCTYHTYIEWLLRASNLIAPIVLSLSLWTFPSIISLIINDEFIEQFQNSEIYFLVGDLWRDDRWEKVKAKPRWWCQQACKSKRRLFASNFASSSANMTIICSSPSLSTYESTNTIKGHKGIAESK